MMLSKTSVDNLVLIDGIYFCRNETSDVIRSAVDEKQNAFFMYPAQYASGFTQIDALPYLLPEMTDYMPAVRRLAIGQIDRINFDEYGIEIFRVSYNLVAVKRYPLYIEMINNRVNYKSEMVYA